jgi:Family of unknown function (DUF5723)
MNKTAILILFFALKNLIPLFAQEQLGVRLENYAGINGVSLNPTHSLDYPLSWNLNLAGVGLFLDNSYSRIENSTVSSLIKNIDKVNFGPRTKGIYYENVPVVDFPTKLRTRYLFVNGLVAGPALSVKIGQNHVAGLFYNARASLTAAKIPKTFNYYNIISTPLYQNIQIPRTVAAAMVWDEIGANYAYKGETYNGFFQIGANIKYLRGYEGAFVKVNNSFNFSHYPLDSLSTTSPSVSYGITNANFKNVVDTTYQLQQTGSGFGFDLGFSYLFDANEYDDYGLKISAALLDIGSVKFSNKAEQHYIEYDKNRFLEGKKFNNIKTPEEALAELSRQQYGDPKKTFVSNRFAIGLPAALCLQADYQFFPHAFANATWIQRLPTQSLALRRGNLLATSVRYEHRWFGACIPLQLYEYQQLRMGLSLRLAFLTIGTDYLGSFVGKSDLSGTDLYVMFKLNPLGLNIDTSHWFDGFGKRSKKVECYRF